VLWPTRNYNAQTSPLDPASLTDDQNVTIDKYIIEERAREHIPPGGPFFRFGRRKFSQKFGLDLFEIWDIRMRPLWLLQIYCPDKPGPPCAPPER
jgi:hypothetical protein